MDLIPEADGICFHPEAIYSAVMASVFIVQQMMVTIRTLVNNGLTSTTSYRMIKSGSYIFVGTYGGIFRSSDNGDNWEPAGLSSSTIYALITIGSNIFAGTSNTGIHLSTDNGNSWTDVNEGLTNLGIFCLAADDTYLFTGTSRSGVFPPRD